MNDSIMRFGVEISELNDEEIKKVIDKSLEQSACRACSFIMKNNPEIKKSIEAIKQKKEKAQKNIILTATVFCENYFKINDKKEFICSFSKNLNWDNIDTADLNEKCGLCSGKLLISAFLMKVEEQT